MSLSSVKEFSANFPYGIGANIIDYARHVKEAMKDIFIEAEIPFNKKIGDQVVLIAGLKRLYTLCSSNYWVLENSLSLLDDHKATSVKFGSQVVSKDSSYYRGSRMVLHEFESFLRQEDLYEYVKMNSYAEIVRKLSDER